MPYYDLIKGIVPYSDDACLTCDLVGACNILTDFNMNQKEARYNEKHIVQVGHSADRENYVECLSYVPWVAPEDRKDLDPEFGTRISQQEANIMSNPKGALPDRF